MAEATAQRRKYRVEMRVVVEIECPDDAVLRVIENRDHEGKPQPFGPDTPRGWAETFYNLDEDETLGMLAWWYGVHGRTSLDGWADLDAGEIVATVDHWAADWVDRLDDENGT